MTNKELIEILQKLPEYYEVRYEYDHTSVCTNGVENNDALKTITIY